MNHEARLRFNGQEIEEMAWKHFGEWCKKHDPDGEKELFEMVELFAEAHKGDKNG